MSLISALMSQCVPVSSASPCVARTLPWHTFSHLHAPSCFFFTCLFLGSASLKAVWIDCDPGHDDAMALILAGHCGLLNVLGVSTVAGNMPVSHTTVNALKVLYISNLSHIRTCLSASALTELSLL